MCAMSPDWPTLSAFQLPCFWNSQGCRELQPWARISERLRRWIGREPALAWPRTGVGLAENRRWLGRELALAWPRTALAWPRTALAWPRTGGRPSKPTRIIATVLCLLLRGR